MLFGTLDVPSPMPSFSEIGQWVVMLGITVVIIERLKALLWAPKPRGDEPITQTAFAALQVEVAELRKQQAGFVGKDELKRLEEAVTQLAKDYKDLTNQMFQRHERLVEAVQAVAIRVESMRGDLRSDIEQAVGMALKK